MLRVGILGKTDSARRKEEIVESSEWALLAETSGDPDQVIEASDLLVLTDGAAESRTDVAMTALRRGRHVFSDWPIAADLETAKRLALTAEESGVELAVNRPDRLHPSVLDLRERAPNLTDVILAENGQSPIETLITDAVDLCLFVGGGSGIHRYEGEAVRDADGSLVALSFALRFHSGSLALAHIRRTDDRPARTIFAGGVGWNAHVDLLEAETLSAGPYDPSTDEKSFLACLERLATGQAARTSLYELEETIRSVANIMTRVRGTE